MADLRSLKKHKVFLTLKRDLAMVNPLLLLFYQVFMLFPFTFFFLMAIQATHIAEELVSDSHKQMKEEEGRHIVAVEEFTLASRESRTSIPS